MTHKIFLTLFLLVTPSLAYYLFRGKIPNGEIVPHPCKANYMWSGVGHENPDGGGARNPFGQDFDNAGRKWTEVLCRYDSDGDGKTNGEELGDPDCEWQEGMVPKQVTGITHPGICEPYGQGMCAGKDTYVDCTLESFGESCNVIKNSDVLSTDFRFKEVEIPNTETNYYCQYFDLPSAENYHVVADEGLIENHNVVHHMLVYGCPDNYKGSPTDSSPNPCSMSGDGDSCNTLISLWTVGVTGNCFGETMGFRVGGKGYKKFKLEIHYNNPMLVSGYMDKSGIRIYYQPEKPGVQDLATLGIGQTHLEIPPGKSSVEARGSCPSDCTVNIVTKPMYIVSIYNHMHYMGKSQRTEVIRNGQVVKVLANDERYDYDSPVNHKLDEPFEVLPGDELATTCVYSSMSKKKWVYYGDATSDEMCFAFLTLYPEDAIPYTKWCTMLGPLSTCDLFSRTPKHGCDWQRFTNLSNPEMTKHYINLEMNCRQDGICREECKEVADEILEHPCLGKEMNSLVSKYLQTYHEGAKFLGWLHSCGMGHRDGGDDVDCKKDCGHMCDHDDSGDGDGDWEASGAHPLSATPQMAAMLMTSLVVALASVTALF